MTVIYLIYIQHCPVFDGSLTRHVEFTNEIFFLLIAYHLIVFTQGWLLPSQFGKFTWSLVALAILLLAVNFMVIIREQVIRVKEIFRRRKIKKNSEKIIAEFNESVNLLKVAY